MSSRLRQELRPLLPGWPRLPAQLWGWGLLAVGSAASLVFRRELWPHTPQAAFFSIMSLALAGLLISIRLVQALPRWYAAYQGPYWLRVLLALFVSGCVFVLVVSALLSTISLLVLFGRLLLENGPVRWAIDW